MKIGKAGNGNKIHAVSEFTRMSDNAYITTIICGAQQFNGSGNGQLNKLQNYDATKISCKKCLKLIKEGRVY